ncbi:hypothetical protein U8291_24165 [Pseudomonas sp. A2]|uniref:hypothetical protein n=1 Tax=Pseudomonas sp. A2 TaxID=107445 RepID=UPI002C3F91C0|nr:hypothetical protein [Pseudomonas sp. A2]MEB3440130.1 hypothetical protein [Pseudomonas sp. A2]
MDLIYLLLCIVGPFLIAILWALRKSEGCNAKEKLENVFKLDADKGLNEQPLFHFGTAIPLLLFMAFGGFAWWEYTPSMNAEGFSKFIEISKLPLAMLAMIVPTGAIIASFHSTKQTAKQIVIAEQKSKSESFYQHRRELFDYFDRFEPHSYLGIMPARYKAFPSIHEMFFIGSPDTGTPQMARQEFDDMQKCLDETARLIEKVITGTHFNPRFEEYRKACYNIFEMAHFMSLPEIHKELECYEFEFEGAHLKTVGKNVNDLLASFRYAFDFFDALCGFCGTLARRAPGVADFIYYGKRLPNKHQMELNLIAAVNTYRQVWDEID